MSHCTQAKQTAQHNTPHLSPLLLFERVDRTSMIQSLRPISQSRCCTTIPGIIIFVHACTRQSKDVNSKHLINTEYKHIIHLIQTQNILINTECKHILHLVLSA